MKNKSAIIIGASGQYGIILANLLIKKKYKVLSTTRSIRKLNILKKKYPNLNFINFNIYNIQYQKIRIKAFKNFQTTKIKKKLVSFLM